MSDELEPWRVEGSRTVLRDPWIHLRADRCITQRGAVLDPFYVLEYRDWAHVVAFDEDDHLLLVRQWRHGAAAFSLELPGGVMEPGEDPLQAGARELLEETGHAAPALTHVAALSPNAANFTNRVHVMLGVGARKVKDLSLDPGEDVVVERVPWRNAAAMALSGEMIHSQHVGLLMMALARAKGLRFG